jgi:hypothetical protein
MTNTNLSKFIFLLNLFFFGFKNISLLNFMFSSFESFSKDSNHSLGTINLNKPNFVHLIDKICRKLFIFCPIDGDSEVLLFFGMFSYL